MWWWVPLRPVATRWTRSTACSSAGQCSTGPRRSVAERSTPQPLELLRPLPLGFRAPGPHSLCHHDDSFSPISPENSPPPPTSPSRARQRSATGGSSSILSRRPFSRRHWEEEGLIQLEPPLQAFEARVPSTSIQDSTSRQLEIIAPSLCTYVSDLQ